MGLSDVMSLDELFCPLGGNRDRISANVRGLRRACRADGDIPAGDSVVSLGNEIVNRLYSFSLPLLSVCVDGGIVGGMLHVGLVLVVFGLVLVSLWLVVVVVVWLLP